MDLLKNRRLWYKAVKRFYCPILKDYIVFNSKGFHHLLFDGKGKARSQRQRISRLELLPLVLVVLKTSTNINEYRMPIYSKSLNKNVEYWLLKERVGKRHNLVSVILRRIGNGNITFYSVWKK